MTAVEAWDFVCGKFCQALSRACFELSCSPLDKYKSANHGTISLQICHTKNRGKKKERGLKPRFLCLCARQGALTWR
jgi:hypothetical protein